MSLSVGVGLSEGEDSYITGVNACQQALTEVEGKADLIILFSSVKYDQEKVNAGVRSVSGDTLLVGASTAGEITTNGPANKHSVVVMAIKSDTIKFYGGVGTNVAEDSFAAGKAAAEATKSQTQEEFSAFIMFPDGLVGNGAAVVKGILSSLGEHFPVVGGAAGDDFKFEKTYQHLNDKVYSGSVVGVGLVGEFAFGIGVKHGWLPIGKPRKVTKSVGSVLHELDGKPAITIYDEYFGEKEAAALRTETLGKLALNYPLGMKIEGSDEMLLRAPFAVDKEGSITCGAEIPENSLIQLMMGSKDKAIVVAKEAAKNAVAQLNGAKPKAVIIFNCIARNKLFGANSGEEITEIQKEVGASTPLIGFYTYGEQAPFGGEVRNLAKCNPAFHNETVVIAVIGEAQA